MKRAKMPTSHSTDTLISVLSRHLLGGFPQRVEFPRSPKPLLFPAVNTITFDCLTVNLVTYNTKQTSYSITKCRIIDSRLNVSQSGTRSLCGRSDCPPPRTILCQRKCIGQLHASVRRDVIKPGGSRTSTWMPPRRVRPEVQQTEKIL